MRPLFGNDITNTSNNSGNGNSDDDSNDNNNNHHSTIIERLTQNGATPVAHIAGKGIIRVVSRCEDAKENNTLGECCGFLQKKIKVFIVVTTKNCRLLSSPYEK